LLVLWLKDDVVAECVREVHQIKDYTTSPGATFCRLAATSSCARDLHAGGIAHCEPNQETFIRSPTEMRVPSSWRIVQWRFELTTDQKFWYTERTS